MTHMASIECKKIGTSCAKVISEPTGGMALYMLTRHMEDEHADYFVEQLQARGVSFLKDVVALIQRGDDEPQFSDEFVNKE
jgi:hypothetical protein